MKNTETVDFCRDAVHRAIKLGKKIAPPGWLVILFFRYFAISWRAYNLNFTPVILIFTIRYLLP